VALAFHWSKPNRLRKFVEKATLKSTAVDMKGWAHFMTPHLAKIAAVRRAHKSAPSVAVPSSAPSAGEVGGASSSAAAAPRVSSAAAPLSPRVATPLTSRIRESLTLAACSPDAWGADARHKNCEVCGGHFGVARRRHHCRACGRVVCQPCSKYRGKVDGVERDVRLCRECKALQQAHVALAQFTEQMRAAEMKGMSIEELLDWQDTMIAALSAR
jgi:hypothetical protein